MLHVSINHHHLLVRTASPDMVPAIARMLRRTVLDETLKVPADGHQAENGPVE
jgi:hypothetical protein